MSEFKSILQQAESLLRQSAGMTGTQAADLREQAMKLLQEVQGKTQILQDEAIAKAKEAGAATTEYVKEKPWQALGIAAGLGLLLVAMLKGDDKNVVDAKDVTPNRIEKQ